MTQTNGATAQSSELSADSPTVLEVSDLKKHFPVKKGLFSQTVGHVYAVDGISFSVRKGETLGLVGESGCGKSTVGKTILRLIEPTSGRIKLHGEDITTTTGEKLRVQRQRIQMVFQDPYSSLNPRMSSGDIVGEPLRNFGQSEKSSRNDAVAELFKRVGLRREQMLKYPHEYSGGQRQRLGIARALALNPSVIVADEPVSALDVSVQAQVINLLIELQESFNLTYLFISHDLAVVEHISHRVAVMYLGHIVELTDKTTLFRDPQHPYSQALLSAVPIPDPKLRRERIILQGDVPSPINPPSGCRFHTRCPHVMARCKSDMPRLKQSNSGHWVACHLHD